MTVVILAWARPYVHVTLLKKSDAYQAGSHEIQIYPESAPIKFRLFQELDGGGVKVKDTIVLSLHYITLS